LLKKDIPRKRGTVSIGRIIFFVDFKEAAEKGCYKQARMPAPPYKLLILLVGQTFLSAEICIITPFSAASLMGASVENTRQLKIVYYSTASKGYRRKKGNGGKELINEIKYFTYRSLSKLSKWSLTLYVAALTMTATAMAAGGGKPATPLINVADTRNMSEGISKWIADIYNTNHWLFALVVVVSMALIGGALGFGFDKAIHLLGIDLGKLDHHE
jgi:hypothetical protein